MARYVQEHWIALLLLLVSLVYTAAAPQYGLKMKPVPEGGVVPFMLGSIFSAMMILHLYLNRAKVRPEEDALNVKNLGFFVGLLVLFAAGMEFSFPISAAVSLALISRLMGLEGVAKPCLLALVATVIVDFVFAYGLGVPLPGSLSSMVGGE